ncbi:Cyclin-like protein [Pseudocohnilembus persalinus]|uniref:Cyclin-like protein n=1 Tax=Pseudocohnilembus persalinus TaxID=266149 RepID=A0A0V0QHS2_PSEPJ|nr:Cyclin-like protein [Pseudocohnilembus persalinus]|eukprot:KRX01746.1 Cyclin-like protein [Pseudocohnilembus persalinus]
MNQIYGIINKQNEHNYYQQNQQILKNFNENFIPQHLTNQQQQDELFEENQFFSQQSQHNQKTNDQYEEQDLCLNYQNQNNQQNLSNQQINDTEQQTLELDYHINNDISDFDQIQNLQQSQYHMENDSAFIIQDPQHLLQEELKIKLNIKSNQTYEILQNSLEQQNTISNQNQQQQLINQIQIQQKTNQNSCQKINKLEQGQNSQSACLYQKCNKFKLLENRYFEQYSSSYFIESLDKEPQKIDKILPDFINNKEKSSSVRERLIYWLFEVSSAFNSTNFNTLIKALTILDTFTSLCDEVQDPIMYHQAAITSYFLASKYCDIMPLKMDHVVNTLGNQEYEKQSFLNLEKKILDSLDWDMDFLSSKDFLDLFVYHIFKNQVEDLKNDRFVQAIIETADKLLLITFFDPTIQEQYSANYIAMSCLLISIDNHFCFIIEQVQIKNKNKDTTKEEEQYQNYKARYIQKCQNFFFNFHFAQIIQQCIDQNIQISDEQTSYFQQINFNNLCQAFQQVQLYTNKYQAQHLQQLTQIENQQVRNSQSDDETGDDFEGSYQ